MRTGRAVVALVFASVGVACSPFGGGAFSCTDSAQCGTDGVCETTGLCSFPDPACGSGRSYGQASGDLAGTCVGDEPDARRSVDGPGGDGPPGIDGAPDGPPPEPFCDPADATQRLCLDFEGDAVDGSGTGTVVNATAVAYAAGQVGQAVVVDGASRLDIAETAAMDFTHMTIEAWVYTTPPGSGRAGVIDNNNQYGFFIYPGGDLRCTPLGGVTATAAIPTNAWTHIACAYDGATEIIYINGVPAASIVTTGNIGTAGGQGTSIAGDNPSGPDRMIGMLDQLRVYSEARTPTQICNAAGLPVCP